MNIVKGGKTTQIYSKIIDQTKREAQDKKTGLVKMETKEIFESGFVKAFIAEYFEYKIHSFYPDKDRLLYVLCNTDLEKQQVTTKQIDVVKSEIQKLGFEDLSFAYLLSCKPESQHNYIEPNKRFDFWLQRFSEEFEDHITDFDPITKAICLYNEVSELLVEVFENEGEFWEWYPKSQSSKIRDFLSIIPNEADLLSLIEYDIEEYNKNEYWEIDFEVYQKFIDTSYPIELLFNISELLVQLNRLEMFNEFLLPHQQNETKTEHKTIEIKPVIKAEDVIIVFDILKNFFCVEEQDELKQLLETGNNAIHHLIFLDNGNRLADAFKQLKKADIITGCQQKELEKWISNNFKYKYRKEIKEYTHRYLNDIISTNKDKCQKPLLNVKVERTTGEVKITKA